MKQMQENVTYVPCWHPGCGFRAYGATPLDRITAQVEHMTEKHPRPLPAWRVD